MDFASTDVEIPFWSLQETESCPLTKLRNNRRKRVLQTDQCNPHVQCFMSSCCTLIFVMSCFLGCDVGLGTRCLKFWRCLMITFLAFLRRCLRDTLREWQVQYVTDFGISIGERKFLQQYWYLKAQSK